MDEEVSDDEAALGLQEHFEDILCFLQEEEGGETLTLAEVANYMLDAYWAGYGLGREDSAEYG